MPFDPARLILPHIATMEPYAPIAPFEVLSRQLGRAPHEIVKLDANENPYGLHPAAREALAAHPHLHVYPDPEQRALRLALAEYTGAPAERILTGHGADELIDLLTRVLAGPGDLVVDCPPTFGMYGFDASLTGAAVARVWRRQGFRVDVAGIEQVVETASISPQTAIPKLLYLTSPNNPDGGLLSHDDLQRLLRLPIFVVVDEAYIEFAGLERSVAGWVAEHENLAVLRTFSKWAGMAGLRLGYGIFPEWLMPILWRAKQPYNVNVAAVAAGLASLAHRDELMATVSALVQERERLCAELGKFLFLRPRRSYANFALCRVEGRDAAGLKAALAERGVLVRYYARPGLENAIRVSAGRPSDTDALLAALAEV